MKKRTMHNIKWVAIPLAVFLFMACGVLVAFHFRPDWKYRAFDLVDGWFDSVAIEQVEYREEDLVSHAVADLTRDDALLLINEEHPLAADYMADLTYYKDTDVVMAKSATEAFGQLAAAVLEETGETLYIRDSYRSLEEQEVVYQEQPKVAAIPGSSEHMTGLALDVYVSQFAGYGFLKSAAGQFVNQNCWKYGFIIRYPQFRESDTKIPFEPWHIRYVGTPHAEIIMRNDLVLEEYMERLEIGRFYSSCGYLITRQTGDTVKLPEGLSEVTVSSDNMGNWVITGTIA